MQIYMGNSFKNLNFVSDLLYFGELSGWIRKIIAMITLRGDYRNYRFR